MLNVTYWILTDVRNEMINKCFRLNGQSSKRVYKLIDNDNRNDIKYQVIDKINFSLGSGIGPRFIVRVPRKMIKFVIQDDLAFGKSMQIEI